MKKVKKVQKSAQHPSDVDEWQVYDSPQQGIDTAASHVYDRPDEAELNDEVAEIRRQHPALSPFQAYVEVARRQGRDNLQAPSTRKSEARLADSLTQVHREARAAGLNPARRQVLAKASRESSLTYLRAARPWAEAADVAKAQDSDSLIRKADELRAADPRISRVQALRRAAA